MRACTQSQDCNRNFEHGEEEKKRASAEILRQEAENARVQLSNELRTLVHSASRAEAEREQVSHFQCEYLCASLRVGGKGGGRKRKEGRND